MKNIVIINGPNLNILGRRELNIYGTQTLEELNAALVSKFSHVDFIFLQSNHEGQLIDWLHEHGFKTDGIVLNAGAYSHTSIALADAIKGIETPVVEVHLSNTLARESFRKTSFLTANCVGVISGFGINSYVLAVEYFANL